MTVTEILANMICAFSGTVAYAIIFNVPKRYYLAGGMTGMTGWLIYLLSWLHWQWCSSPGC